MLISCDTKDSKQKKQSCFAGCEIYNSKLLSAEKIIVQCQRNALSQIKTVVTLLIPPFYTPITISFSPTPIPISPTPKPIFPPTIPVSPSPFPFLQSHSPITIPPFPFSHFPIPIPPSLFLHSHSLIPIFLPLFKHPCFPSASPFPRFPSLSTFLLNKDGEPAARSLCDPRRLEYMYPNAPKAGITASLPSQEKFL